MEDIQGVALFLSVTPTAYWLVAGIHLQVLVCARVLRHNV